MTWSEGNEPENKHIEWYELKNVWQRSPILRLLDKSLWFRIIVAFVAAYLALLTAHLVEQLNEKQKICQPQVSFAICLKQDLVSVLSISNIEGFSILVVAFLYIIESRDRKRRSRYEAWQVIDNAAAAGVPTSYARFQALQDLNADGVSLKRVTLPRVNLQEISLPKADLSGADLSGANLIGANLIGANLIGANLIGANLIGANLIGADLMGADLIQTNLMGADLRGTNLYFVHLMGANLIEAKLMGADLRRADLIQTNLMGANLIGANFHGAELMGANLMRADLRGSINLTLDQVESTHNSEDAIYDDNFRK